MPDVIQDPDTRAKVEDYIKTLSLDSAIIPLTAKEPMRHRLIALACAVCLLLIVAPRRRSECGFGRERSCDVEIPRMGSV